MISTFSYIFLVLGFLILVNCSYRGSVDYVTYHSGLKLLNEQHMMKLNTRKGIHYGGGANQQTVTAKNSQSDYNTLWTIEKVYEHSHRGEAVKCEDKIKLRHVDTGKTLHCLHVLSPLSKQLLITAEGDHNVTADHWYVECNGWLHTYWQRSSYIKLRHADTGAYLAVSGEYYQYPMSIHGHMEVVATYHGEGDQWTSEQGIFFKKPSSFGAGINHSEL